MRNRVNILVRRAWIALCVPCIVLVQADTKEPVRTDVHLMDGSHLIGTMSLASIRLRTWAVRVDTIKRVENPGSEDRWRVTSDNGDRLTGSLDTETGQLVTVLGQTAPLGVHSTIATVDIPVEHIFSVTRSDNGPGWSVSFRNGDRLTGGPRVSAV